MRTYYSRIRSLGGRVRSGGSPSRSAGVAMLGAVLCLLGPIGCAPPPDEQGTAAVITLSSPSLVDGTIPAKYTCDGGSTSPALSWSAPPPGTRSLVLIMNDLDSIAGHLHRHFFVHWLLYSLPADTHELPEGIPPQQQQLPDGARQGKKGPNDFGYGGPCPDGHAPHHYAFTLYALDAQPELPVGATEGEVRKAMQGHVIGRGQLIATFHR
jgi:Raf kinase inhibitor-like YbhB/YbcL family protein